MVEKSGDSLHDEIARRAHELRSRKDFDPRREKELNDLYEQYVPPHALKETSHLLDVAERDAYIDPFPPIGSQKLAGGAIKKGVRVAIGWYIQYIAQQMSTFGSGVAQSLRAIHHDVEELKNKIGSSATDLYSNLDLTTLDGDIWNMISSDLGDAEGKIVISDAPTADVIDKCANILVIDSRAHICNELPASVDSRVQDILSFMKESDDQTIDALVLQGHIDFLSISDRAELIRQASRTLKEKAPLILIVRTQSELDGDEKIAQELSGIPLWGEPTWKYVLNQSFESCEARPTGNTVICVARNKV
jgi:hypothetical protein